MLPTAEWAAQISASSVPRIRQKEYPAMFASRQASSKVWLVLDDRPQTEVILQYKLPNPIIVIPSFAKFKTLTDFYGKFARFSLIILILFCISSSYPIDAIASTGGAGIFFYLGYEMRCNWQDLPKVRIVRANRKVCLEKKERSVGFWKEANLASSRHQTISSFQVVGQFI